MRQFPKLTISKRVREVTMRIIETIVQWILIAVLGYMLQMKAIDIAYNQRGYNAYGGEYLVLPLVIVIAIVIRAVWHDLKDIYKN